MARNIEFDKDEILEKAMNVFWEKGFHGTSMSDLIEATGLHKGSLYNSFGSKEDLYLKALSRYGIRSHEGFSKYNSPLEFLESFYRRLVEEGVEKANYNGCFVMNSNLEFGHESSKAQKLSKSLFDRTEENFEKVIKSAIESGDLPKKTDVVEAKRRLVVGAFSIREMSKFNKDRDFLESIARNVLKEFKIDF